MGPLLFLIMMHDITADIYRATVGSFADDTRLWKLITAENRSDLLQEDLIKMYEWADMNNMQFNSSKFERISFGNFDQGEILESYRAPDNNDIQQKPQIKDLGIIITHNLLFDIHIKRIVQTAMQMSGWILRTFRSRDVVTMKTLLHSHVVSKLEYACLVWSPVERRLIDLIESVQKNFTRRIAIFQKYDDELKILICNVGYTERLQRLKLYSLERRRERYQILYVYKILLGLVLNHGDLYYRPIHHRAGVLSWGPMQKIGKKSIYGYLDRTY